MVTLKIRLNINEVCVFSGDLQNGELGLGAVPGREQDFRQGLAQAVQYAKALDCKRYFYFVRYMICENIFWVTRCIPFAF